MENSEGFGLYEYWNLILYGGMNMDLYEAVYIRKSVRSYRKEPVEEKLRERILSFAAHLFPLDGQKVEYELAEREALRKIPRIFCPQAPYYLTIYSEKCNGYEENAGYLMQQIALYIITKGLGCCFVGEPLAEEEKENMVPVLTLAFGWAKEKNIYRREEEAVRLPLKTVCTMRETVSKEIMEVLKAARLAPSSWNSQPWRFVVYKNRVHIFCRCKKSSHAALWNPRKPAKTSGEICHLDKINMGIMMANLLLIAEQLWIETEILRLENIAEQEVKNYRYFLTVRFTP